MYQTKIKNKYTSGQSLFEVVVAIALISIIVTTIVSLTIISLKNNIHARNKTAAQNYTQEAYEWLRQEKINDWDMFLDKADGSTIYCLDTLNDFSVISGSTSCHLDAETPQVIPNTIGNTQFIRTAVLTQDSTNPSTSVFVVITVSWNEGGKTYDSEIETIMNKI